MIRKWHNQEEIPIPKTEEGKNLSKPSEQLFPNRRSLAYPNLTTKYENAHKVQTADKNSTPKHKAIHCIVLYIALHCVALNAANAMYCIVLYCIVLYCIVLYCIVLYCIVISRKMLYALFYQ